MNTGDGVEYWLSLPIWELLLWQDLCYEMIQAAREKEAQALGKQ